MVLLRQRDLRHHRRARRPAERAATTTSRSPRWSRPSCSGCSTPARARARACATSCSAARPPPRASCCDAGWPVRRDLRAHPGVLAGHASNGRPLPGVRRRARPRRRDPRHRPDRGRRRHAAHRRPGRASTTGASPSSAASPTRSSPAGRTSRPPRSRPRCSSTRRWPTPPSSPAPTRSGARPSPRSVVLRAPADPEELRAFVGERLAPLQGPQGRSRWRNALPRNASGKLLRGSCDERLRHESRARWATPRALGGARRAAAQRDDARLDLDGRRDRARSRATRCSSSPPARARPASWPPS